MPENIVFVDDFTLGQKDRFCEAVLEGLAKPSKEIPCKFFYDERGSRLFEKICGLEEYYLMRTEESLLRKHSSEIVELMGAQIQLVEFGAGSLQKVRILLESMNKPAAIIPIDISRTHLIEAAASLAAEYPDIEVLPVCADFILPTALPESRKYPETKRIGFFPGSTIGNFTRQEAVSFLKTAADNLGPDGDFLLGVDLKKNETILHAAYNDSRGLTAAFNLNLLRRMNRELRADFDLSAWRHKAVYNDDRGRMEMYLVSLKKQSVGIMGHTFHFNKGETIHTENSYKYEIGEFHEIAEEAGFAPLRTWVDDNNLFSLHYLRIG